MATSKKDIGAVLHKDGVTFRVWAPFARSVAVTGSFNNWGRDNLDSEGDGYWATTIKLAEAGQEYKFVIGTESGELFKNDPRSLQVTTTEGNSVITDPSFDWSDDNFTATSFNQSVIYELHIGTFYRPDKAISGMFSDAMEKLDYLADLGINTIKVMPIGSMPDDRGWGYAPDYIYAVESLYGGRREFMEFVNAAHTHGIAVILDVVYNHFGPGDGLDLWRFDGWYQNDGGGIYFYNDWRSVTPWGSTRPDYGRVEVQQYILDNVKMWLHDCHVDGLRLDSTIYFRNVYGHNDDPANDIPDAWLLMQNINNLARKLNPGALMIAEDSSGNQYVTKQVKDGGAGFSSQWEVTFPGVVRQALNAVNDSDRNLIAICNMLAHNYNGDAFQRIVYSDSHDTDAWIRLSEEVAPGKSDSIFARKRAIIAAAIVMTATGIPMIFMGQEFMQDGKFSDWESLDWERTERFAGVVLAHKHLIALRKNQFGNTTGLTGHNFNVLHLNDKNKVLSYHRWDKGGAGDDVVIVINFSNQTYKDYNINLPRDGKWSVRFNSSWKGYGQDFKEAGASDVVADGGAAVFELAPYCVQILSQD